MILINFLYLCISKIFSFITTKKGISKSKNTIQYTEKNNSKINLLVGYNLSQKQYIYIPEKGLYQNFLITGTIGSGKTSSAMYPFTNQFLKYNSTCNNQEKIAMLILDVKGNYYSYVNNICNNYNLNDDLIIIELNSKVKYNPLDKPNLKPQVLANRLKTILLLFSENNSESFWLDKVEQILCECIKICRLYNNNYVTFLEIHKLVFFPNYYKEKIILLREKFINAQFSQKEIYDLNSSLDFFQKEFENLDTRTLAILKSEIGRITNTFISDYDVLNTFSPDKKDLNFKGFTEVLSSGKIVVLNMNISEYRNLSMIIATYLKLDFQTEIMNNLSKNEVKTSVFICDEYDKYASKTDGDFFSLSREAKCINIVSTQSYSSLKNILKDDSSVKVIVQNLINKIWFRTDDIFTIEEAQKLLGKELKNMISKSISENAKETRFSYITNSLNSEFSNISETYSTYTQKDFTFDTNFFSQELETFSSLNFLSDGIKIFKPSKFNMLPYFRKESK